MPDNSIFALSSGKGRSGIAIIRISGPETDATLSALLFRKVSGLPPYRTASLMPIFNPNNREKLDEAIIIRFAKSKSFTGEDVAELHLHGGPAVINAVLIVLEKFSELRVAEPREFTRRAFENGRLDLTEVEGLADLINSETEMQRRQAVKQMEGGLGKLYGKWRETIVNALAYLEANIDFSEAELPSEELAKFLRPAFMLTGEIKEYLNDGHRGELLRDGIRIAIIGAPNTGKSSLLNAIVNREVSIISDIPGTTRDVLEAQMDIGGYPMLFADTAGIRYSGETIEKEGIRRAKANAKAADLRILVVDATNPKTWDTISEFSHKNDIVVINKMDIASNSQLKIESDNTIIKTSAKTGDGIDRLIDQLKLWAKEATGRIASEAPALTRARHRKELELCVQHLQIAAKLWKTQGEDEITAEETRLAARALGRITGGIEVEDLLDVIFRDFCIGK